MAVSKEIIIMVDIDRLRQAGFQTVFTKYGEAYSGYIFEEINFPNHIIIIQASNLQSYNNLQDNEKTSEKIKEYGRILHKNIICERIDYPLYTAQEQEQHHQQHYINNTFDGCFDRKVMFIFGAGASAYCVYGDDEAKFKKDNLKPPLGNTLFGKQFECYCNDYKGVQELLPFLQDINVNVEEFFEKDWQNIQEMNDQIVMTRHINIQYYLQEILKEVSKRVIEKYSANNLYVELAKKLQQIHAASHKKLNGKYLSYKKFAFVSFNQDTILETYITQQFGKQIKTLDDYVNVNDSPYCIFKPHGSWNWGWQFPNPENFHCKTAEWLFNEKINYFELYFKLLGDHLNMIEWNAFGHEWGTSTDNLGKHTIDKSKMKIIEQDDNINHYYPALLIPYRDKDEFTMPLKHFYRMRHYFGDVETLVIIGWKGNEDLFNRQLLNNSNGIRKVIIVDPNPNLVKENLKELLSRDWVETIIYNDFENFVMNGVEKEIMELNTESV